MRKFLPFQVSAKWIVRLGFESQERFSPALAHIDKIVKAVRKSNSESAKAGLPAIRELAEPMLPEQCHKSILRLLFESEDNQAKLAESGDT
jgi:hypothetical protein